MALLHGDDTWAEDELPEVLWKKSNLARRGRQDNIGERSNKTFKDIQRVAKVVETISGESISEPVRMH